MCSGRDASCGPSYFGTTFALGNVHSRSVRLSPRAMLLRWRPSVRGSGHSCGCVPDLGRYLSIPDRQRTLVFTEVLELMPRPPACALRGLPRAISSCGERRGVSRGRAALVDARSLSPIARFRRSESSTASASTRGQSSSVTRRRQRVHDAGPGPGTTGGHYGQGCGRYHHRPRSAVPAPPHQPSSPRRVMCTPDRTVPPLDRREPFLALRVDRSCTRHLRPAPGSDCQRCQRVFGQSLPLVK